MPGSRGRPAASAAVGDPRRAATLAGHELALAPRGPVRRGPVDPASIGVEVAESDNQGDAESWLGENWRELLARGVATVTLFDGDDEVYGPMGLAAT